MGWKILLSCSVSRSEWRKLPVSLGLSCMHGDERIMERMMELGSSAMYFQASTLRPRPVVLDIWSHSIGGV